MYHSDMTWRVCWWKDRQDRTGAIFCCNCFNGADFLQKTAHISEYHLMYHSGTCVGGRKDKTERA